MGEGPVEEGGDALLPVVAVGVHGGAGHDVADPFEVLDAAVPGLLRDGDRGREGVAGDEGPHLRVGGDLGGFDVEVEGVDEHVDRFFRGAEVDVAVGGPLLVEEPEVMDPAGDVPVAVQGVDGFVGAVADQSGQDPFGDERPLVFVTVGLLATRLRAR